MNTWLERIKPLFDARNMGPKEIAKAVGCSVRDVYHWNRDNYQTYKRHYFQFSNVLGVSVEYLKGESEEMKPAPNGWGGLNAKQKQLIDLFELLTEAQQDFVIAQLQGLVQPR